MSMLQPGVSGYGGHVCSPPGGSFVLKAKLISSAWICYSIWVLYCNVMVQVETACLELNSGCLFSFRIFYVYI